MILLEDHDLLYLFNVNLHLLKSNRTKQTTKRSLLFKKQLKKIQIIETYKFNTIEMEDRRKSRAMLRFKHRVFWGQDLER